MDDGGMSLLIATAITGIWNIHIPAFCTNIEVPTFTGPLQFTGDIVSRVLTPGCTSGEISDI
jgi:hypothetical protein